MGQYCSNKITREIYYKYIDKLFIIIYYNGVVIIYVLLKGEILIMTIDEAINQARKKADKDSDCWKQCSSNKDCETCEREHEQFSEWLEELKALRLLLDWAIECDFGLDSFPEEYEKYKHTLTDDMTYKDMMIQIAKCVVAEEIKEN